MSAFMLIIWFDFYRSEFIIKSRYASQKLDFWQVVLTGNFTTLNFRFWIILKYFLEGLVFFSKVVVQNINFILLVLGEA